MLLCVTRLKKNPYVGVKLASGNGVRDMIISQMVGFEMAFKVESTQNDSHVLCVPLRS